MQMPTGTSNHPEESPPSFFKVIRYPSAPHLELPKAFVIKYLKKIPKNPTIVTESRDRSWRMELVKIGEDYCFAHGWEKLAKDAQLCLRDIIIFWLIDSLTFKVIFLSENGCEKDLPFDKINDFVVKDDGQDGDIVGGYHDDGECHSVGDHHHNHNHEVKSDKNLCFEKVFSGKTYKYFMSLPVKFMRAAELEHTQSITLKDHEGKEWRMGILAERYAKTKYSLSAGWTKFRQHHNISEGDVCKFDFNKKEGVLTLTQMIKSKRPIEQDIWMEEVNRKGNVDIEDDWSPAEKPCHCGRRGGGKVKIEYESDPEMEGMKKKREKPSLKSFANVKIEDGSDTEMVVEKGKRGMPPLEKPNRGGGVEVQTEQGAQGVFRSKHVIYF